MQVNTVEHAAEPAHYFPPLLSPRMRPWSGPLIDIDRNELERRLRNRLVQLKEVLFVDDDEVNTMARDLAEAVMG